MTRRDPPTLTLIRGRVVLVTDSRPPTPWADWLGLSLVWVLAAAIGLVVALWLGAPAWGYHHHWHYPWATQVEACTALSPPRKAVDCYDQIDAPELRGLSKQDCLLLVPLAMSNHCDRPQRTSATQKVLRRLIQQGHDLRSYLVSDPTP